MASVVANCYFPGHLVGRLALVGYLVVDKTDLGNLISFDLLIRFDKHLKHSMIFASQNEGKAGNTLSEKSGSATAQHLNKPSLAAKNGGVF